LRVLWAAACALGLGAAPTGAPTDDVLALARLAQVRAELEESVAGGELASVHAQDVALHAGLAQVFDLARDPGRDALAPAARSLGRAVVELQAAADSRDRELARTRLPAVQAAFDRVGSFFDAKARAKAAALALRFTCPMHPEVVGRRGEACARCGMPLSRRAPVTPPGEAGGRHTVRAEIRADEPLSAGREATAVLRLSTAAGAPVTLADLREVHTRKIHLLIVDEGLTDYHHEHPAESAVPGEYTFRFTPRQAGRYRAFADVQPLLTGLQEFAMADLPPVPGAAARVERTVSHEAAVEGLHYRLTIDGDGVRAGQTAGAHVRVMGADGAAFAALEPVMEAFGHLVGFHEDRTAVLHLHPIEDRPPQPGEHGGPDLAFRLYTDAPGYYRLFLQVQVGGRSRFVPFGLQVAPAR
jgi:hypothetical protein